MCYHNWSCGLLKEYYEQSYALKFDNLDEMDWFLERQFCKNSHKKKIVWKNLYVLKKLNQ